MNFNAIYLYIKYFLDTVPDSAYYIFSQKITSSVIIGVLILFIGEKSWLFYKRRQ